MTSLNTHHWLPPEAPAGWLVLPALLLAVLWVRSHRWTHRLGPWPRTAFAIRSLLGAATLLTLAEGLRSVITWSTPWPLTPLLAGGAVLVETVLAVGRLERGAIAPRTARWLAGLRVGLVLAAVALLGQPVIVRESVERLPRDVTLLLDVSASMQVPETGLTPAERLRLAEALGVRAAHRPVALDRSAQHLRELGGALSAQVDALTALAAQDPDTRRRQWDGRRSELRRLIGQARQTLAATTNAIRAAVPPTDAASPLARSLNELNGRIGSAVSAPLEPVFAVLTSPERNADTTPPVDAVLDGLRGVAKALAAITDRLAPLGDECDAARTATLTPGERAAVDAVARLPRAELARQLLTAPPAASVTDGRRVDALLDRLHDRFRLHPYTFASQPAPVALRTLHAPPAGWPTGAPADANALRTDLAAALEQARRSSPAASTAGIVLLTDGRHNAASSLEPVARLLARDRIPLFPIVLGGGAQPPTDAAIADVQAPDTVGTNDTVLFQVQLKADGLTHSNIVVRLFDGATCVATNVIGIPEPTVRRRTSLTHTPALPGLHLYRVTIDPCAGEVMTNNNVFTVPVSVTRAPLHLLLVDDRPRWEFRYLKNLFTSRDRSVRQQYVLLAPDRVADATNRPAQAASVLRAETEAEATALPAAPDEWLKFDVIILGDIARDALDDAAQDALDRFVRRRGGTLVVIAGPRFMPHAFAGTRLGDLLPATFTPAPGSLRLGPEPEFHVALTAEGREHVIMRLAEDSGRSAGAWSGLPAFTWRHVVQSCRPGATVLAYAQGPASLRGSAVTDAAGQERTRQAERDNALIVTHTVGAGKVLFLATDQLWRLRTHTGDLYHHRFWGQVLRWATDDRLAVGTGLAQLGADRPRYTVGQPVRLRARLRQPDFTPLTGAAPVVNLQRGEEAERRVTLGAMAGSPGLYDADLGALPEGRYRATLAASAAVRSLPGQPDPAPATAEFAVLPAASAESVELAADRGQLNRLATLTGGRVFEPERAHDLMGALGPPVAVQHIRRQTDLWNSWPFFLLILLAAGAEWGLRKKVGLP